MQEKRPQEDQPVRQQAGDAPTLVVAPFAGLRERGAARMVLRDAARLVGAARRFGAPVEMALLSGMAGEGQAPAEVADAAAMLARLQGVRRVWLLRHAALRGWLAEPCAEALRLLVRQEGHGRIVGDGSMAHREALGRLAGLLRAPALSDVIAVPRPEVVRRPMHAGSIIAELCIEALPVVLLLRTTAFAADEVALVDAGQAAPVEVFALPADALPQPTALLAEERTQATGQADLARARIVLGMGRGAVDDEARALLLALADRLGAAVAATRAVVDEGLAPGDWQVGQTGKRIAPALYLAFGISGAHQHLAGITEAEMIVAVNRDAEAPIFAAADCGLVADAAEVLRALLQRLPADDGNGAQG